MSKKQEVPISERIDAVITKLQRFSIRSHLYLEDHNEIENVISDLRFISAKLYSPKDDVPPVKLPKKPRRYRPKRQSIFD